MNRKYLIVGLFLLISIGTVIYVDSKVDFEEGINVYHMKGENFNVSYNFGSMKVSPGLNDQIFGICFTVMTLYGSFFLFTMSGGLKLLKEEELKKRVENDKRD